MASRPGGPSSFGNITTSDARGAEHSAGAELNAGPWTIPGRCQWRTPQYHDQECRRFFDCPSHLVARSMSAEANNGEAENVVEPAGMDRSDRRQRRSFVEAQTLDRASTANDQRRSDNINIPGSSSQPAVDIDASNRPGLTRFYLTPPMRTSSITNRVQSLPQQRRAFIDASSNSSQGSDSSSSPASSNRTTMGFPGESPGNTLQGLSLTQALQVSAGGGRVAGEESSRRHSSGGLESEDDAEPAELILPRWQPDAEVTYCPICQAQFSIFVRKHHCRKCGRVVCNSCSPHRIIIPHQFIVRPPGVEVPLPSSSVVNGLNGGFLGADRLSGGERVRLCNPCVPDPNTAPPQSPTSPSPLSPRSARQRSRSSFAGLVGALGHVPPTNRYGGVFVAGQSHDPYQQLFTSGSRSLAMDAAAQRAGPSSRRRTSANYQPSLAGQFLASGPPSLSPGAHQGGRLRLLTEASSSRQRALPLRPQLAEEDECPICHLELPSRSLPNYENLREVHITECIRTHSAYGSPRTGTAGSTPATAPRRSGMYIYAATEKDCVDDAECTICLEEFTVGVSMARLECLCRFHRTCISAWFVNHPGRCPVHQHDGFGY